MKETAEENEDLRITHITATAMSLVVVGKVPLNLVIVVEK